MNCPICKRNLASSLSICPSCGTMVKDSVREELEVRSAPLLKPAKIEEKGDLLMSNSSNHAKQIILPNQLNSPIMPKTNAPTTVTAEIMPPQTVPTLVEFQSKNSTVPDWRLQLQNAVRQRKDEKQAIAEKANTPMLRRTKPMRNGSNALKPQVVEEETPNFHKNERIANALKRIERSREVFLVAEEIEVEPPVQNAQESNKNFPFYIAARTNETTQKPVEAKATVNVTPKPKLVSSMRNANGDFDTNKLPPLVKTTKVASSFDKPLASPIPKNVTETKNVENSAKIEESAIEEKIIEVAEDESEEIDDFAPFSMRVNAGIFDLIIGSFASLILLAPFMLAGGEWFSFKGVLAFFAVSAIVMFIYMTTAIGMFGKTFGMRIFSLELVDAEENEYPTFHQAAVSSSVYLLSLIFGGIGFLTVPFTEDKRAVHDIVSGTIVVKEY